MMVFVRGLRVPVLKNDLGAGSANNNRIDFTLPFVSNHSVKRIRVFDNFTMHISIFWRGGIELIAFTPVIFFTGGEENGRDKCHNGEWSHEIRFMVIKLMI